MQINDTTPYSDIVGNIFNIIYMRTETSVFVRNINFGETLFFVQILTNNYNINDIRANFKYETMVWIKIKDFKPTFDEKMKLI